MGLDCKTLLFVMALRRVGVVDKDVGSGWRVGAAGRLHLLRCPAYVDAYNAAAEEVESMGRGP